QPAHALAGGKVAADLAERADLGAGQLEWQVRLDPIRQLARGDRWGGLALAGRLALGERQLVGEELVVGEAPPRRRLRRQIGFALRAVERRQRLAPRRPALLGEPRRVLPLGQ